MSKLSEYNLPVTKAENHPDRNFEGVKKEDAMKYGDVCEGPCTQTNFSTKEN
jgi:hypothetical protein